MATAPQSTRSNSPLEPAPAASLASAADPAHGGLSAEVISTLRQADEAFASELPMLLVEHEGEWVAYSGAARLGIAATKTALYRQCRASGYSEEQLLICCIEPQEDFMVGPDALVME